jgi:glucose/arabinose dehydrogenase
MKILDPTGQTSPRSSVRLRSWLPGNMLVGYRKLRLGLLCMALSAFSVAPALAALQFQAIATGLTNPIGITHAGDNSGRLFITLQGGQIRIFDGVQVLATPFLDIQALIGSGVGEQGLLGLAFHPKYETNGFFYVNYTNLKGNTVVARYHVSADPNVADPASRRVILRQTQPFANHNGGQLQFGPDGFLYIGLGDGGAGGDPGNRAQRLNTLLGKILRIDVNGRLPYRVPPSNPFVGRPGARPEIWAYGLRNPWRFSFDRTTGNLFIGDVGQNAFEEIDFQRASSRGGENYGWRRMEGRHCFNPTAGCGGGSLKLPIVEYSHNLGCAVIGGYVYRGSAIPQLRGRYLFGDFCSGRIWGSRFVRGRGWTRTLLQDTSALIAAFGEDQNGELYFTDLGTGSVNRITGFTP